MYHTREFSCMCSPYCRYTKFVYLNCISSAQRLFELFLGTQLASVSTFLLAAVLCARGETGVTFSAHGLLTIVPLGQQGQRRIVDPTTET